MTQPNVLHTQGTKFQRGELVESSLVWTWIAQCKDITPADASRSTIDVTTIDQYDGNDPDLYKQFVGGLIESGAIEIDSVFDPDINAPQRLLEDDIEAAAPVDYRILYIDGSTRQFKGIVTSLKPTNGFDDVCRQTISIKVTGKSIYTAAE